MCSKPAESALRRKRRWWSRCFYPVTVLLVWGLQIIAIIVLVATVKSSLQQAVIEDMEMSLKRFLTANQTLLLGHELYAPLQKPKVEDFSFIRIIRDDEHLFFSASSDGTFDIRSLARLDPKLAGCWLELDHAGNGEGLLWNIVAISPDDRVAIQAGRPDQSSYRLYRRIVNTAIAAGIGAFFISLALAFLSYRAANAPLRQLKSSLRLIQSERRSLLDPSQAVSGSYQQLYDHINRIILHNRQLVKEMQASLDNVAHDLRTPMTRLRSVAEYGLQSGSDPQKLQDALADCLEESQRILAMLNIMMSVAEAESGTLKLEVERFDLDRQIDEIVQVYGYLAEERNIEITTDISDDLEVSGDRTRLSQVWANLIDNAIKYNIRNGSLHISGHAKGDRIEVAFRDTGIGISRQETGKIWDRLYRGDRSRTEPGLGLGLNYVKAVIDAHGGRIDVESELNRGTTFTVVLKKDSAA